MMIRSLKTVIAGLALAVVAFGTSAALADNTVCNGQCTYGPGIQIENLIISEGSRAVLVGTQIDGNIFVQPGATLIANHIVVGGNIQAESSKRVKVLNSMINGDIQVDNSRRIDLIRNAVGGNIQLFSNTLGNKVLRVAHNIVGGDVQAESNISKRFTVSFNTIEGNLQGESNVKKPTGKGNVVQGDTDGQFDGF